MLKGFKLFDTVRDPQEKYDISLEHPFTTVRMLAVTLVHIFINEIQQMFIPPEKYELEQNKIEQLKALGYV